MKTTYDYVCYDCGYSYGKDYQFGKAPDRSRCPGCNKLCNRDYSQQSVQFKGQEWYTNQRMAQRSLKSKSDNKKAWEALHEHTKRSVEQAQSHEFYKSPSIKWDQLREQGRARKLSSTENEAANRESAKHAKRIMEDGHNIKVKK